MTEETLTLVIATDRGLGPDPLTLHRPKAALPFGGKFRVIDFTLANCLHSGLRRVLVLTQYKSHSLHKHLRDGWSIFNPELGEFITPVPPQMREGASWYAGALDGIRQNRFLLERSSATRILVLDGGYVYRMDYAEMIRAHLSGGADVSIALRTEDDPNRGGPNVHMDKDERISDIGGSVVTDSGDSSGGIAEPRLRTMGVCLFEKQVLLAELDRDESGAGGARGLMGDLVPSLLSSRRVLGYRFGLDRGRVTPDRYWCDLASIDAYYDANLALLRADPPLDLYQKDWSIRTYQGQYPPARTIPGNSGTEGIFVNSMLAAGTLIVGGGVNHSILCPRVRVEDRAIVDSSILCDGVTVGEGSHLRNCIVDKDVQIPPDMRIGFEPAEDRQRFTVSDKGVVVIPKGYSFSG
ncbi:MAG: glucose-1-phosphate adenylyltransferase [Chromatiaceae bacterium]|jgi:glucose-1-phosphate adenylyltransferase|nr:glucose-1-phosphate adenylyltransferase [Chromatiaceae bacterium]